MTITEQLQEAIQLLGGSETQDNLISTKLIRIISLLGGSTESKLISEQLDVIIELLKFPIEYRKIEYIESSGTQYIDTGFILKNQDAIEMDVYFFDTSEVETAVMIAGARSALRVNDITIRTITERIGFVKNTSIGANVGSISYTRRNVGIKGNSYFIDNTATVVLDWNDADDCIYNCWLFSCNQNGLHAGTRKPLRLYSCKMWDGETLVRDFIPCVRKSDSVAGLYDAVNNVFYANAGTGEFIIPK